jgi:hypothetical protein
LHRLDVPAAIRFLSFTADGETLQAICESGSICCWQSSTGKERSRQHAKVSWGSHIGLAPDGKRIVSNGTEDGQLWTFTGVLRCSDLGTNRERWKIRGEKNEVYWKAAFTPDGKLIAGSRSVLDNFHGHQLDHQVCLMDAATGRLIWRRETQGKVTALVFSPDGQTLVSGGGGTFVGMDRTISVWDVATGRRIGDLTGHLSWVNALAFSADGKFLVSGSADQTLLAWDTTWPDLDVLKRRLDPAPPKAEKRWAELSSADAAVAHNAAWSLVFTPKTTLPFLREHLHPERPADARQLARLITDLDSAEFEVREKATRGLEERGELAGSALRQALRVKPSKEVERRINLLLERLDSPVLSPEELRLSRTIAVLERLGTPEARQLLTELSRGAPDAYLTKEAASAQQRLSGRTSPMP